MMTYNLSTYSWYDLPLLFVASIRQHTAAIATSTLHPLTLKFFWSWITSFFSFFESRFFFHTVHSNRSFCSLIASLAPSISHLLPRFNPLWVLSQRKKQAYKTLHPNKTKPYILRKDKSPPIEAGQGNSVNGKKVLRAGKRVRNTCSHCWESYKNTKLIAIINTQRTWCISM